MLGPHRRAVRNKSGPVSLPALRIYPCSQPENLNFSFLDAYIKAIGEIYYCAGIVEMHKSYIEFFDWLYSKLKNLFN
jgi:hypothetical protein